jgi:hypothetical protein
MSIFDAVTMVLLLFLSASLLVGSQKRDSGHHRELQWRSALAGSVGIAYVATKTFWFLCGGYLHSNVAILAFYVGYHVIGGMVMAVMLSVVTKRTKALFALSTAVFLAFNVFAIFFAHRYRLRLMLSADSTGFFVGGLLCWFMGLINRRTERSTQAGNDQPETI